MCKESLKCVIFLKGSNNLKGSVFSKSKFHAFCGKCNSCEKRIAGSETLFMPAVCASSSLISLTTTIQVSAYVCSGREAFMVVCVDKIGYYFATWTRMKRNNVFIKHLPLFHRTWEMSSYSRLYLHIPLETRRKLKFGAGGSHKGNFKDLFWAKSSGGRREVGRATHDTHLGRAAEDCMYAVVTLPAHWLCFLEIVDHCCRLTDRTFASDWVQVPSKR